MSAPNPADLVKFRAFTSACLNFSGDRTADRLLAAAGAISGVEAHVVVMLALMWDDLSAVEAERDTLRARAEAAEASLATARAEGAAAERAAVVRMLGKYRDHAERLGLADESVVLAEVLEVIDAEAHLDQPEGA